jgi:hypothetical protein
VEEDSLKTRLSGKEGREEGWKKLALLMLLLSRWSSLALTFYSPPSSSVK